MAKRLPVDLLEQVQAALRDHPAGLALRELEARLTDVASRRSLQRKLNGWQRKGLVRAVGIRHCNTQFDRRRWHPSFNGGP